MTATDAPSDAVSGMKQSASNLARSSFDAMEKKGDVVQMHRAQVFSSNLNRLSESDACTSSAYSSSVSSVESSRDRAHLTLDFNSMKPRLRRSIDGNDSAALNAMSALTSSDSSYSPPSTAAANMAITNTTNVANKNMLSAVLLAEVVAASPQFQQNLKNVLSNGISSLNSPLQAEKNLVAQIQQLQQRQANNPPVTKTDETPTPSTFIYPKNVTTPQKDFSDGFQKALSHVYNKHHFEPPPCTPSTVKCILSLLTPGTPLQKQSQQQQEIISLFRNSLPSVTLTSPTVSFFNTPSLPTSGAFRAYNNTNNLLSTVATLSNGNTSNTNTQFTTNAPTSAERQASALAYQQLLSSPTSTSHSAVSAATAPSKNHIVTAAAVAAAFVAASNAASPTDAPQPRKSPRLCEIDERQLPPKISADLLNGFCKLDPNNPNNQRYMDFLQQQTHQQHQSLNSSSFLTNFAPNSTASLHLPLNFSQNATFLPTTNVTDPLMLAHHHSSQQQQHDLHAHHHHHQQQQQSQIQPLQMQQQQQQQQQQAFSGVKQENDFSLHEIQPIPSTSSTSNGFALAKNDEIIMPLRRKKARSTYSDNSSANDTNGYGNSNDPFDDDQELIKLERKRERNRAAASKCRQRKMERIMELEEQVEMHKNQSLLLQSEIEQLKCQINELNETVNRHRLAGCRIDFKMPNI